MPSLAATELVKQIGPVELDIRIEVAERGDGSVVPLRVGGARIGEYSIIGAGALVFKDTKDFEVYKGQASKPSRAPSNRLRNF